MVYPMSKKRKAGNEEDGPALLGLPTSDDDGDQDRVIGDTIRNGIGDAIRDKGCEICCGSVIFIVIVGAILLAVSLKRLQSVEYGLEYTRFSKHLDELAKTGGLHAGPPGFRFIKFPSTFITADLSDTCVSQDGLRVQFKVAFQYQISAEMLLPAILKYRDYQGWVQIVESAGNSAVQHTCSEFIVSEFQTKRDALQLRMEANLREKLEGSPETQEGVHALAISLQLKELTLPPDYKRAVESKQSSEEDIYLAKNQRLQEVTKAKTTLLSAEETSKKIRDTAENDANVTITRANLKAEETIFAFQTEAAVLKSVKDTLELTTEGLLAYISNQLFAVVPGLKVQAQEPTKISRYDEL